MVSRAALDNGYFSADNVEKFILKDIEPYIASGSPCHNQSLEERGASPTEAPKNANLVEAMQHRMKTTEGKKFIAQTQIDGGTCVRHHQRNHGVPPFHDARL